MLKALNELFGGLLLQPAGAAGRGVQGAQGAHRVQLATAVLLVEVMRADAGSSAAERASLLAALRSRFATLTAGELDALLERAEDAQRQATDFFSFTSALNDALADDEKLAVVQAMWDVAFADGHLADHEQHVLWRVADLLHVPKGAYVAAKARARERAAGGGG